MIYSMVTFPSMTSTIASVGAISNPWFAEWIQYIWLPVGVSIVVYVILAIPKIFAWFTRLRKRKDYDYDYAGKEPGTKHWDE